MDKTQVILRDLWKWYGSKERPAEWDGNVYGGSHISQRYWELLTTIQYAELDEDSVVLDIGGSGAGVDYEQFNGAGFLARLLSPYVKRVIVADPACKDGQHGNIYTIGTPAFEDSKRWERLIKDHAVNVITSVSVLEHVAQPERLRMLRAMQKFAVEKGVDKITLTCEFHPTNSFWPHQLHTQHLGECLSVFTDYYPDRLEASFSRCVNALSDTVELDNDGKAHSVSHSLGKWYPIAIRLRRGV